MSILQKELQEAIQKKVFIQLKDEHIVDMYGQPSRWLFDFRRVTLEPKFLDAFAEIFWEKFEGEYPFQVCGLEVAAISLVSAIVMKSIQKGKPVNGFFIRKSRKKQGLMRMIEGEVNDEKIILVDDLMNRGGSFLRQVEVLESGGKKVDAAFAILRFRDEEYYTVLREKGIRVMSLFSLNDFQSALGTKNLLEKKEAPVPKPFEVKWYFKSEKPNFFLVVPKSSPLLDEKCVYFGSDSGYFWALDRITGKPVWKYKIPFGEDSKYIISSPARYKDFIYFGAYDGNFYALDRHTGKRRWVFMEGDWIGSSPAVAEDLGLVYVGLEFGLWTKKGGIVALDVGTGKKKWEYSMKGLTHGSPAYSSELGVVVCGCNSGEIFGFDARKGTFLWKVQAGAESHYSADFHPRLGLVYIGAEDGKLYAIRAKTGEIAFTFDFEFGMYSTPLVVGDRVYLGGLDKNVYCIDAATGKEIWRFRTGARIFASPVFFQGKIYIGSNNGKLYELDPATGENTAFFLVTERITNAIAGDEKTGEIFLSTFANELYCLKKST